METQLNFSLKDLNTFGIDVKARRFIRVQEVSELEELLKKNYGSELFILGGGSNMLLTQDIEKTVVHLDLKGIEILEETEDEVVLEVMAGENWHQFVLFCIENDYGGLENLSLIPGNVGTAPIQNIGAYGVELKDVFEHCTVLDTQTLDQRKYFREDCEFGYRDSIFKKAAKGRFIILKVAFRLSTKNHQLKTSYGAISSYLKEKGVKEPSIRDISEAVIHIRQSKLPDPRVLGNSGSFFKNPVLEKQSLLNLQKEHPDLPYYELDDGQVKIPAGWLIEKAGFKGYRKGDAGVHKNQALVLVNYGEATGDEILRLALQIKEEVKQRFGISIEAEVNIF